MVPVRSRCLLGIDGKRPLHSRLKRMADRTTPAPNPVPVLTMRLLMERSVWREGRRGKLSEKGTRQSGGRALTEERQPHLVTEDILARA